MSSTDYENLIRMKFKREDSSDKGSTSIVCNLSYRVDSDMVKMQVCYCYLTGDGYYDYTKDPIETWLTSDEIDLLIPFIETNIPEEFIRIKLFEMVNELVKHLQS